MTDNKNNTEIQLKVYRGKADKKSEGTYTSFHVPVRRWTTVLDALLYAKEHLDRQHSDKVFLPDGIMRILRHENKRDPKARLLYQDLGFRYRYNQM